MNAGVRRALGVAWVAMVGVTALGHVTGLRNTLTVLVALVTLGVCLREWRALPCKLAVLALVLWAVASLLWSPVPEVTLGKLRTDLLIPLLAAVAAFFFARDGHGLRDIVGGLVAGSIALALLSMFAYVPTDLVPQRLPVEQAAGIVRPLPHWYPGPGDASMFSIVAIAPLTMAWRMARMDRAATAWLVVAGALVAFVLVTTNNRNAVLVAPLVLVFHWLLDRRDGSSTKPTGRSIAVAVCASLLLVAALAAVLEWGARERLAYLHKPLVGDSAAIELVSGDTRPTIWRYYFARGLDRPFAGYGFGRTVPGIALHTESDRQLAAVEPNAYIHAHNVAMNWWLQLGLVGLGLLVLVIAGVVRAARRWMHDAGDSPRARLVFHALVATLVATLARNLTDDFLVYGMATVLCVILGALLGELSRLAREHYLAP